MFDYQQNLPQDKLKLIFLVLNRNSQKKIKFQFKRVPTLETIKNTVQSKWNITFKHMRIFNAEGVQYESQDLQYLKSNEELYISQGQQFDSSNSFHQYQILKKLGEGGFGRVLLGKHKTTQQLVAIKFIKTSHLRSAHELDMAFRQIQNLNSLNHPHIVKIHNCYIFKQQMQIALVMEYMEGGQLLQYLKEKQNLKQDEAKKIFKQIVNAIIYCHSKNIIHRDLKPENILFKQKKSYQIKVVDFGISGIAQRMNPDFDSGTLKYMAPEVLSRKQKQNSPLVDVWALGCILYYLLFGKAPFTGLTSNQIIRNIIENQIQFPQYPIISIQAKKLIKMMLQKNPKDRIIMRDIEDNGWVLDGKRRFFMQEIKKNEINLKRGLNEKHIIKKLKEQKGKSHDVRRKQEAIGRYKHVQFTPQNNIKKNF